MIDIDAARRFLAAHGRLLDRRRLSALTGDDPRGEGVAAALDGYRNADGGYGFGLEPDLRDATSQPAAALHAFEALADVEDAEAPARSLCDWLATVTLADGGLPFALAVDDPTACAPFWVSADPTVSSLQITSVVALHAHRLARRFEAVASHPWLVGATDYCRRAMLTLDGDVHAIELAFATRFAAALGADAGPELDHLAALVPRTGVKAVAGGVEGEAMRPLDFAPRPGTGARALVDASAIDADLERLAGGQQADGGWAVDFASASPIAGLEWRGYTTVEAIATLRANGRG